MAAGTSSLKNGCLSLLQERKLSIGGGSKSGKLYFFNITFDGRLQCFEDKELKILKEEHRKEDIKEVQLIENRKDFSTQFRVQFKDKHSWLLKSPNEKERALWVQAFTTYQQPAQEYHQARPHISQSQLPYPGAWNQRLPDYTQQSNCPYPVIRDPLLPPAPLVPDKQSHPNCSRPHMSADFLQPDILESEILTEPHHTAMLSTSPSSFSNGQVQPTASTSKVACDEKKEESRDAIKATFTKRISTSKLSAAPFHMVSIKNIHELLNNDSIDPNAKDGNGCTALHWYVMKPRKHRHELLMRCLESRHPFNVDARDKLNNTALHLAAEKNDLQYARILVAFGAQVYPMNSQRKLPYMLAPAKSELYLFLSSFPHTAVMNEKIYLEAPTNETRKMYGMTPKEMKIGDMMQPHSMSTLVQLIDNEIINIERAPYVKNDSHVDSTSEYYALKKQREYLNSWRETGGNRVLFLDGGGIRGLVQIEVLMELEKRTGCKVTELFDWIVGTSTGGLVALGLIYAKKTLSEMKQVYFQIKNKVFVTGSSIANTYMSMNSNSQNMDEILRREFGDAPLSSIKKPRVMICTVNKECVPLKVQFFNNFMTQCEELTNVPVWHAARATSAAPIYFTPFQNKYIDGGVKANNPCLEAMRVIKEHDSHMGLPERHFLLTVSIGTGMYEDKAMEGDSLEKGLPLIKHVKHLKQLLNMFVQELGNAESTAQSFAIMCQTTRRPIPCFRFNPLLEEEVSSGETDDKKIINMIINTKLYLAQKETTEKLDSLVKMFRQLANQSLH